MEIEFVGLRDGEKFYEELLIGENVSATPPITANRVIARETTRNRRKSHESPRKKGQGFWIDARRGRDVQESRRALPGTRIPSHGTSVSIL